MEAKNREHRDQTKKKEEKLQKVSLVEQQLGELKNNSTKKKTHSKIYRSTLSIVVRRRSSRGGGRGGRGGGGGGGGGDMAAAQCVLRLLTLSLTILTFKRSVGADRSF